MNIIEKYHFGGGLNENGSLFSELVNGLNNVESRVRSNFPSVLNNNHVISLNLYNLLKNNLNRTDVPSLLNVFSKVLDNQKKFIGVVYSKNRVGISRIFSNAVLEKSKQKVCIIPGGRGHLGREYTIEAIKQGYNVIVVTRDTKNCKDGENLHHVGASHEEQCSPEFWKELLSRHAQAESILMINTVGAPVPPPGKTLREVNVLPPLAMVNAMKELDQSGVIQKARFVHLSSMGAVMLKEDPYGITKKEAEDEILNINFRNVCVLRVGYAFQSAEVGRINIIDNIHAYSPEQLAALPVQPLIGSGKQNLQPVYTGDIVKAGLNYQEGVLVVNAIGKQVLSQENFVRYYSELADRVFLPIRVPLNVAEFFARHFPKGHFSPYAVEGCKLLEEEDIIFDPTDFEKLIGHETSTLEDVYGGLRNQKIYYPMPPIKEHALEVIEKTRRTVVDTIDSLTKVVSNR